MDDNLLRARFNQLFDDAPSPPAPTAPARDTLSHKLRAAREAETHRLVAQDQVVARIQALAEAAGIVIEIYVPPSPLRSKLMRKKGTKSG